MTTTQQLIATAETRLRKMLGASYNPHILAEKIEAGIIPEDTVIREQAGFGKVVVEGDEMVHYKDGQIIKRHPMNDILREGALIQYAIDCARNGTSMGSF